MRNWKNWWQLCKIEKLFKRILIGHWLAKRFRSMTAYPNLKLDDARVDCWPQWKLASLATEYDRLRVHLHSATTHLSEQTRCQFLLLFLELLLILAEKQEALITSKVKNALFVRLGKKAPGTPSQMPANFANICADIVQLINLMGCRAEIDQFKDNLADRFKRVKKRDMQSYVFDVQALKNVLARMEQEIASQPVQTAAAHPHPPSLLAFTEDSVTTDGAERGKRPRERRRDRLLGRNKGGHAPPQEPAVAVSHSLEAQQIWAEIPLRGTEELLSDVAFLSRVRALSPQLMFSQRWVITCYLVAMLMERRTEECAHIEKYSEIATSISRNEDGSRVLGDCCSKNLLELAKGLTILVQKRGLGDKDLRTLVVGLVNLRIPVSKTPFRKFDQGTQKYVAELLDLMQPLVSPGDDPARLAITHVMEERAELTHSGDMHRVAAMAANVGDTIRSAPLNLLFPLLGTAEFNGGHEDVLLEQMREGTATDELFPVERRTLEGLAEQMQLLAQLIRKAETSATLCLVLGHTVQEIFLVLEQQEISFGVDATRLYLVYFKELERLQQEPCEDLHAELQRLNKLRECHQMLNSNHGLVLVQAVILQAVAYHALKRFVNAHPLRRSLPTEPEEIRSHLNRYFVSLLQ